MDKTAPEYKTKDFYLAVTIKALGNTLKRLEPDEMGKGFFYFVFDDSKGDISNVEMDLINQKLLVEPKLFINTIKEFKQKVHSNGVSDYRMI